MKILIVEDNKSLLDSISSEMSKHFEVERCEDGDHALYLINQNIYDLLILDWMLPHISGIEILKSIRKKDINTQALILTAKESLDDKVSDFEIGSNDYLTKHFYM